MSLPTYTGSDAWSQGSRRYCGTGAIGRASGHPTAGNPGFRGLLCVIEACLGLPAPSAIPSARMGSIPCPVANLRRIQAVVSCLTPGDAGTAPSRTRRAACKSLHHAAQQGKQAARQEPELCARILLPSSHPPQPLLAGAGHEPASRLRSWAAASIPVTASRRHAVALSRPDPFGSYEAGLA